jgi:hypothetical protein
MGSRQSEEICIGRQLVYLPKALQWLRDVELSACVAAWIPWFRFSLKLSDVGDSSSYWKKVTIPRCAIAKQCSTQ